MQLSVAGILSGGGCEDWPFIRRFISKFSGLLARGLTRLSDPTSGFMAIRKDVLNGVMLDPVGWKIVLEVIVKTGARFQEVPIVFADRQKGESKLDTRVQAQYIAHLWKLYFFKYPVYFSVSEILHSRLSWFACRYSRFDRFVLRSHTSIPVLRLFLPLQLP